jgi:hypothetical protein
VNGYIAAANNDQYRIAAVNQKRFNFVTAPVAMCDDNVCADVSFVVWLTDWLGAFTFHPWITVVVTPVAFRDGIELRRDEFPHSAVIAANKLVHDIRLHAMSWGRL